MLSKPTDDSYLYHLRRLAEATPNAPAILAPGQGSLSHHQLWEHICEVATKLNSMGVGRGDRVAIVLPNGPAMATSFLAVGACATCAPLNPSYSESEFSYYFTDLSVKALIVHPEVGSRAIAAAQTRGVRVIELAFATDAIAGKFDLLDPPAPPKENGSVVAPVFAEADDVALVLHTSGTTSRSKIVPLTHANLLTSARNIARSLSLSETDRCLNIMPLFHIHGLIGAVLSSLVSGGSVICSPGFQAEEFLGWLRDLAPSWYTAVPTMHQAIVNLAKQSQQIPHRLRFIRSSSSALAPSLMGEIEHAFGVPMIEAYGMTEASHQMAANPLPPGTRKPGSVGLPAGPEIAILNDQGGFASAGETGEIVIRGSSITRGYEANPDANAAAFINGWFRTGDLGFLDNDGYLFLVGRTKEMINRGGEKISPREVDEVLAQHPAVLQVITFAAPHATLGEDVAAAIVLRSGASATVREIQNFAAANLADFKVPRRIVFLDKIPLGPTGKPQRIGLAAKLGIEAERTEYLAPSTSHERTLAGIWNQLLGLEVGIKDNFFDLGGHSLTASQVISRVRRDFRVNLTHAEIFDHPTIQELAAHIETLLERGGPADLAASSIQQFPRDRSIPLTMGQHRMWYLHRLRPGNSEYNSVTVHQLSGLLDFDVFARSFEEVVRRHEALRTTFQIDDRGEPAQVVTPHLALPLCVQDLQQFSAEEQKSRIQRAVGAERDHPFDLETGPLVRVNLLTLSPERNVLIANVHHIVTDGWSRSILFNELSALYRAFSNGEPSPLADLPFQYADYAVWSRQRAAEDNTTALDYWKNELAQLPPSLQLTADKEQRRDLPFAPSSVTVDLSPDLTAALKRLSRESEVTLFVTLLAAFQVLLFRSTGEPDVVVGVPYADRNIPELESLIGFVIDVMVVRTKLSGRMSFRETLRCVREKALGAQRHPQVPYEELAQLLPADRRLASSAWFQVMLIFQNFPTASLDLPDIVTTPQSVDRLTAGANVDLTLGIKESESGLSGAFEYNANLFDQDTIQRLAGHFRKLIESLVGRPDEQVSMLAMMQDHERDQVLQFSRQVSAEPCPAKNAGVSECVHHIFETRVQQTPGAIAVQFQDQRITYAELNARANQLAYYLRSQGVGAETLVGISIDRSIEMLVGLLGILKAGGAYIPLDPNYPRQRLEGMLSDSRAQLLLTREHLLSYLPTLAIRAICLDRLSAELAKHPRTNPTPLATPASLAYVIYTSGSTGKPKGVMIEHQSLAGFTRSALAAYQISHRDRVLQFATINFDAAAEEIYPCLAAGGTLFLRTDEMLGSAQNFLDRCNQWELTVLDLPTAYWSQLIQEMESASLSFPSSVRLLIIGGEQVLASQVASWRKLTKGWPRLVNTYGPTEATVVAAAYEVPPAEEETLRAIPIGRPLNGAETYILDTSLQPLPIGVRGELYIGGRGVARGYLNDPGLTEERFVANPFVSEVGSRLYRTSDAARYRSDGNIEFLGRLDNQVKIHGYRIELAEVEAALGRHPAVAQTKVVAREDTLGDKRLVAYVVPRNSGSTPDTKTLRRFMAETLADYMLPSAFVWLAALPLGLHGKVDANALPVPDRSHDDAVQFRAPRDEQEQVLAVLFSELLGVERVGIDDDFFALGGHSLTAMRLVARIKALLFVDLPVATLFEASTIADLARVIASSDARPSSCMVPIQPHGSKPAFFCVHGLGGPVISLRHLGYWVGKDQPVYGVQAVGLDGERTPHTSVEEMAAHYVQEMRRVQPAGPYYLGGWSFGSVIAYEMAQQLRAADEEVAIVAIFDGAISAFLPLRKFFGGRARLFGSYARFHYMQSSKFTLPRKIQYIGSILQRRVRNVLAQRDYRRLQEVDDIAQLYDVAEIHMMAARKYRAAPYDGKLALFRSAYAKELYADDPTLGWSLVADSEVEILDVPGDHNTMLQPPQISILAQKLVDCLERAQGRSANGTR